MRIRFQPIEDELLEAIILKYTWDQFTFEVGSYRVVEIQMKDDVDATMFMLEISEYNPQILK